MSKKLGTTEEQIIKDFGDVLIPADTLIGNEGRFIRTTLSLDNTLHGGLVEGVITTITGLEKSGKTTLCLEIIKNAQQQYKKKCYYLDVEGRLRTDLLKTISGLVWTEEQEKATDIPRLQIIKSSRDKFLTAEDYVNIMEKILRSEPGCLIVVDSVAALCTDDSFSALAGESRKMMGVPSLMYQFLRKAASLVPVMMSNIIFISHITSDPSKYGNGKSEVGGNALKYFSSNKLICFSVQKVPKDGPQIGQDSKFKCTAAATGAPAGEAIIYIRYGHGCDYQEDLITIAEELGFIVKAGAWYSWQPSEGELIKTQGRQKLVDYFRENQNHYNELEQMIRSILFGN